MQKTANVITKTYAEFLYPGSLFIESQIKPVEDRNIENLDLPKHAFGVRFFDRVEADFEDETLKGQQKNHSGTIFIGQAIHIDNLHKIKGTRSMITSMKNGRRKYVVKTRCGNFQHLHRGDRVLDQSGKQVWPRPRKRTKKTTPQPQ